MKRTVVLGASPNPNRYSFVATERLTAAGHQVAAVGLRAGSIGNVAIQTGHPTIPDVDTVTLYVGAERQPPLYNYILGLNPRRIIFNPGTENSELVKKAREQGIETAYACTLVMLSTGQY